MHHTGVELSAYVVHTHTSGIKTCSWSPWAFSTRAFPPHNLKPEINHCTLFKVIYDKESTHVFHFSAICTGGMDAVLCILWLSSKSEQMLIFHHWIVVPFVHTSLQSFLTWYHQLYYRVGQLMVSSQEWLQWGMYKRNDDPVMEDQHLFRLRR